MSKVIQLYGLDTFEPEVWRKVNKSWPLYPFLVEARAFNRGGTEDLGGYSKEFHCKKIIEKFYPGVWKHWNDWLEMVVWAWCMYEEIGATGCMASGKSFSFSFLTFLEWACASHRSAAVISSTTKEALRSRVWHHIKRFKDGLSINGRQVGFPAHAIDSLTMMQANRGDDMHKIVSVAVEGGNLVQAIGSIQGRHPQRMVMFVDEGEQCPEAVFSGRFNLRGGTTFFRFASAANAVNPASPYGQFIEPKKGWASVQTTDDYWETKTGICLHFRGPRSINVRSGKIVVPGLINQSDIDAIVQAKGTDSLEYWMYVEGFPAMSGVRNTVLSWAMILESKANQGVLWQGKTKWISALDPAFTSGGDGCMLRFARIGTSDEGVMTLGLMPTIQILFKEGKEFPPIDYQIADRIKEETEVIEAKEGVVISGDDFSTDSTAASGLASIIEQRWKPNIRRINFGSSPTDRTMPGDTKTAKQRCHTRVEEMWFTTAAYVRLGQIRGLDPVASEQFCIRQYTLEGERYKMWTKKQMKKETGGKSPDDADVTSLLVDKFFDIAGIDSSTGGSQESQSEAWERLQRETEMADSYAG